MQADDAGDSSGLRGGNGDGLYSLDSRMLVWIFGNPGLKYIDEHPGVAIKEVAKMLGVPKDTLYGWTKAEERRKIFGADSAITGSMTDTEKELARLRRENRDLQDALEILKKAISILND